MRAPTWKTYGLAIASAVTATLPILRVVSPAALAVHIMTDTELTGATYDVDVGQQLVTG